ncbi:cobalt-precorrin-5B (C(1))-methyltransferase CbiD [Desulfosarcina ovata]|uniref:Cobalt-precorrin-5B C(1)-methyltransferase n=1 Tax=Desulfosarcina ovata subsp. ovata TaxID=2752305 RepID=A0A5K8A8R1_9BACT|nr:cobalt-precorrin-5B (C(1))-methyltransferase CbiD [Desulfosarcina ovata]BBO88440.1 cobalt-precorrin-5B C(1)-methyltransferase [Desulfosarcina ovata subsp. ovata]
MNAQTKKLRSGFTTGAAAAAAAKAALLLRLTGQAPDTVTITFLTGTTTSIPVRQCRFESPETVCCTVIKDAGDDPDITHGAEIGACVRLEGPSSDTSIRITGGVGVGTVTRPGLEIPPGQPAITPGPLTMITNSIREVLGAHPTNRGIHVEVFVPEGERLARKTLNARLGIVGGLSILGTTGIVRPMSHEAYVATIEKSMDVARAAGMSHLVLTTGRRSERFAQRRWPDLNEMAFIQIGDFFQVAMAAAATRGFATVTLAVFFGKAVKMAQNIPHTHAAKSELTLGTLARWTRERTADRSLADRVAHANTARHAFDPLKAGAPAVIRHVAEMAQQCAEGFAEGRIMARCVIFDYDGSSVVDTRPDWG